MISMLPFKEKYIADIINCLKRNYPWMNKRSETFISDWLKPVFFCNFYDEISIDEFPYKHGLIMVCDNRVVGFLGEFIVRRYDKNSKPYIMQSGTTWAIDEVYRPHLYSAMKALSGDGRVFLAVTAIQSMEELYTSVYGFTYTNKDKYRFFPVPFQGKSGLLLESIGESGQIDDNILKIEYRDHIPFGVKCIKVCAGMKTGYVFYRLVHANGTWVRILKIVNREFISNNVHEVFWKIQKMEQFNDCVTNEMVQSKISAKTEKGEWVRLECDKSFLNEASIRHPQYDIRPAPRLLLNKCKGIKPCNDLLYTELAIMDFG